MIDCVVVMKLKAGEEMLAVIHNESSGIVKLQHPHYVKFNPLNNTVAMVPYCPLSDETFFEFDRSQIQFLVTANTDITTKFLNMVDALSNVKLSESLDEDHNTSLYQAVIEGNSTVH